MTFSRPKRPTSPARAAAARANGAKSRGPVSAQGKSNSSRNSFRHGFRSRPPLFADSESQAALAANIETFERDFAPQSPIEHALVQAIAVTDWRRACLLKLQVPVLVRESEAPARSLHDQTFSFAAFYRLDLRYARQHRRALDAWIDYCAANPRKMENNERPPEPIENTASDPNPTREPRGAAASATVSLCIGDQKPFLTRPL